jgi:hypothetical protein
MIGNDFVKVWNSVKRKCGECGNTIPKGEYMLASYKDGKCKKIVCSEECRLEFDAWVWQFIASKNAARRKR